MTTNVLLSGNDLATLVDGVAHYFAWGIGFGAVVSVLAVVVRFIVDFFRY